MSYVRVETMDKEFRLACPAPDLLYRKELYEG